jgi:sorting nexin-8
VLLAFFLTLESVQTIPIVDISVEQVASLASQNDLPSPSLDLLRLAPSTSTFNSQPNYSRANSSGNQYGQYASPRPQPPPQAPSYDSGDVWNTNPNSSLNGRDDPYNTQNASGQPSAAFVQSMTSAGAGGSLAGTGLPKEWWLKQKTCRVRLLGAQGFILNRYMVYEISTEVRTSCLI